MGTLNITPNLDDQDGFFVELVRLYDGLNDEAATALSARLILILCNHIGDREVLSKAFARSRADSGK